jgi:hypothetical protein
VTVLPPEHPIVYRAGLAAEHEKYEQRAKLKRAYADRIEDTAPWPSVLNARKAAERAEAEADRLWKLLLEHDELRADVANVKCRWWGCPEWLTRQESYAFAGYCEPHCLAAEGKAPPPPEPSLYPVSVGSPY